MKIALVLKQLHWDLETLQKESSILLGCRHLHTRIVVIWAPGNRLQLAHQMFDIGIGIVDSIGEALKIRGRCATGLKLLCFPGNLPCTQTAR